MIRVKRILSEEELCGLEIKGHANSDEHGKDLVCAAVSSIITGGFNALVKDEIEEITLEEGYAKVVVCSDKGQIILDTLIVQLKTIEISYPKNIKIK